MTPRRLIPLFLAIVLPALAWDEMTFDLPSGAKESLWRDALAEALHGRVEVRVPEGRIDVLTEEEAIEVDFQHKWKEGLGQCLVYARAAGKRPALALITYGENPGETTRRTEVTRSLSPSGVRHNSGCRYFDPAAPECGPDEGRPCGVCGG